ncbi:hypothetical protein [Bacillus thuringiensis]|nr:hypothetical protein [Bacillus thuringiensis]
MEENKGRLIDSDFFVIVVLPNLFTVLLVLAHYTFQKSVHFFADWFSKFL